MLTYKSGTDILLNYIHCVCILFPSRVAYRLKKIRLASLALKRFHNIKKPIPVSSLKSIWILFFKIIFHVLLHTVVYLRFIFELNSNFKLLI